MNILELANLDERKPDPVLQQRIGTSLYYLIVINLDRIYFGIVCRFFTHNRNTFDKLTNILRHFYGNGIPCRKTHIQKVTVTDDIDIVNFKQTCFEVERNFSHLVFECAKNYCRQSTVVIQNLRANFEHFENLRLIF